MPFDNTVSLVVGDKLFSGWGSVTVTRSIEQFPAAYTLGVTEQRIPVRNQSACIVKIGADTVLTGWVEERYPSLSATSHEIAISGRSKGCDIVDCSVELTAEQQQIQNVSFRALVENLVKPFGLTVTSLDGDGPIVPAYSIPLGTTPWQVIDEIARYAGFLVYDDVQGNLVISRAGRDRHASGIVEGSNVETASVRSSVSERFSKYIPAFYSFERADQSPGQTANVSGMSLTPVVDPAITRYRPRYIVSEQMVNDASLAQLRAEWEMARRYGRSETINVRIDNWRDSAGKLWTPNQLIPVSLPTFGARDLLWIIAQVTYTLDADGTHADLVIMPPDAFKIEPSTLYSVGADVVETQQNLQRATPPDPAAPAAPAAPANPEPPRSTP